MKKEPKETASYLEKFVRNLFIIIGAIITAVGLEAVLIPNDVIDGGITGISIMIAHLSGLSLSLFIFILNIPFVYVGYKQLGKTFAFRTVVGIASLAIATSLLHHIPTLIRGDSLLVTVLGGIMIGVGIGIVLRNGGALDGTEVLAVLIAKKIPFSVGEIIMVLNIVIFSVASSIYGLDGALYSALAYFIAIKVIDVVQVGFDESKSVTIISNNSRDVGEAIQARLGRSVTYIAGEGGHKNEKVEMIYCVINRLEESKMKTIIKSLDTEAFITISDVAEVKGGNFKKRNIH
ncbi:MULTISPECIES: YitT family protein [unclassified Psychrobacillus]|uniref:YitT family protein n=1 Tax=unclassified Psychrobacillus TaxID=2636677 RepID=UPI0030FC7688